MTSDPNTDEDFFLEEFDSNAVDETVEATTDVEVVDTGEGPFQVLFVDDEQHILKAVRRLFSERDYGVLTARDGEEALELLGREDIAVLVSDQRMPGMSGAELLDYARRNFPQITRVMLTGNNDGSTAVEAINQAEVFRFVTKPWEHDHFLKVVDLALEQHELKISKEQYEDHIRAQNEELRRVNGKLQRFNEKLEKAVEERTREVVEQKREIDELYRELQDSFDGMLNALLSIMELGEIDIVEHCRRTAARVSEFGEFLGIDDEMLRELERAALLHWIGLINASPSMIRKSVDDFDAVEQATWEFHPLLGQQAIRHVRALEATGRYILYYLRRYDDPEFSPGVSDAQLGDEELTESFIRGCQILGMCSSFEQVRTAYQGSNGGGKRPDDWMSEGLTILDEGSGGRFDPELVDEFRAMMGDKKESSTRRQIAVSFDELESGMVLAQPLETAQGIPVAPRDMIITPELIERLERFRDSNGLDEIYVWD